MGALAIGLGLEPGQLAALHQGKTTRYCYSVAEELLDGDGLRIAKYTDTDFETLTLLFQDSIGGFEVEAQHFPRIQHSEVVTPSAFGAIDDAAPIMIVKIGNSLERWTSSHLRAVVHRVSRPSPMTDLHNDEGKSTTLLDRYSIAFSGKPNRDISLLPLAPFVSATHPAIWGEISAHNYNQSKLVRTT